jgi:hypothetical protein
MAASTVLQERCFLAFSRWAWTVPESAAKHGQDRQSEFPAKKVGREVVVGEALTVAVKDRWGNEEKKELAKDTEGKVPEINAEERECVVYWYSI